MAEGTALFLANTPMQWNAERCYDKRMGDQNKRFNAYDVLVIAAGAGLGGPFCAAAAKAALDGNTLQAITGFIVGLPLLVLAGAFPFVKHKLNNVFRTMVVTNAGSAIFFLILVAFAYVIGPTLYQHFRQPTHQYLSTGPIDEDFEGRPLGFLWDASYLDIQRAPNSVTIATYLISAKNLGAEEITLNYAYIISSIDSTKLELKIAAVPDGMIDIKDASPIPAGAPFQLQANFRQNNQAVVEGEFIKTWDSFYVVLEANGEKIRHFVSRAVIHGTTSPDFSQEIGASRRGL